MAKSLAALQFDLLRELFDLARVQRASLERDDIDTMLSLMDEREVLLDQLSTLVEEAAVAPENLVTFPGAEDHARQDALALDTVIRGILEHDRMNQELLEEKVTQLREELPRLQQGRRLASAYRPAAAGSGSTMSRIS